MQKFDSFKDTTQPHVVHLPNKGIDFKTLGKGKGNMPTTVTTDKQFPDKFRVDTTPGKGE